MATPPIASNRILRLKQVTALTGLSRSAIYDRLDPKSKRHDPHFPKQVKLGTSSNAAVGWHEAEILAWISQCSVVG
nr:AlpA family phage regulatory protein [Alkanindiges illinoisensis]